jgi:hypothetical protein
VFSTSMALVRIVTWTSIRGYFNSIVWVALNIFDKCSFSPDRSYLISKISQRGVD